MDGSGDSMSTSLACLAHNGDVNVLAIVQLHGPVTNDPAAAFFSSRHVGKNTHTVQGMATTVRVKAEQEASKRFVHDLIKDFDHPEALRALTACTALSRIFAASLFDGSNGLNPQRQEQARIDAMLWVAFGTALEEHCAEQRH